MEKEKWIEEVFESTKGLQRQEPSPFLFEKVLSKIETEKGFHGSVLPGFKWALGVCMILIIAINVVSLGRANQKNSQEKEQVSEFNNSIVYNY